MKKSLKWIVIVLAGLISLITIVLGVFYVIIIIFIPPLTTSPDTPVDYKLPTSATILAQQSGLADFFGDYSFCASFTLSDAEIKELRRERFDWFTSDGRTLPTTIEDWQEGQLPREIFQFTQGSCQKQTPNRSTIYKYLHKRIEGGQERLLVIHEERNIVYYYRSSW